MDQIDRPFPDSSEGTELKMVRQVSEDAFGAVREALNGAAIDRLRKSRPIMVPPILRPRRLRCVVPPLPF